MERRSVLSAHAALSAVAVLAALTALPFAAPLRAAAAPAHEEDWTDWVAVPDHYQGAVDFRYREDNARNGAPQIVYQFRNHYSQKVTLSIQIEGDTLDNHVRTLRETITIDPGADKQLGQETRPGNLPLLRLTQMSLLDIAFSGTPPPATIQGRLGESTETRRLRAESDRLRRELRKVDRQLHVAELHSANIRSDLAAPAASVFETDDGNHYMLDSRDQYTADLQARRLRDRLRQLADQIDVVKKQLHESRDKDTVAFGLLDQAQQAGMSGDWATASTRYTTALNDSSLTGFSDSDLAAVNVDLAVACHRQGKEAGAEAAYRRAIVLAPQNPSFHGGLGITLLAENRAADAEKELKEAIRLSASEPSFHHNLGMALSQQGRFTDAEAEYREALRLDPGNAESENGLGEALARQEKYADAVTAFREAVRVQPKSVVYRRALGVALAQKESWDEAEKTLREAIRLGADDARSQDCLGVALYSQDKYADALAAFQEAVRLDPQNDDYKSHLQAVRDRLAEKKS